MASSKKLEDTLKRIIYLNNAEPRFYAGNPVRYQCDLSKVRRQAISDSIESGLKELFTVLDAANSDPNLPRRFVMFFVLGHLFYGDTLKPELKTKATAKALELSKSDEEFFTFIKYYTQTRRKSKMSSSVEKVVRKFYGKKTPLELAQSVAKFNSYFKWTHKDLIKLAHVKSDTPEKNVVINYILRRQPIDTASVEQQNIIKIIEKSDQLRSAKESVDAIPILTELKLTIKQVSPALHHNGEVWAAALENMSLQEILPCLTKLYRLNLLKANSTISNHLTNLFTSPQKVKASGVHPFEVFTSFKRLEKGGKPLDEELIKHLKFEKHMTEEELKKAKTRTEAKCPHILSAMQKCFNLSCNNVSPVSKRYLVTIDVTQKAKSSLCIASKVLTFLEAAVTYTLVLLRAEKDVMIAAFKDDKIALISVDKKISFHDLLEKVKSQSSTNCQLLSPIEWASREKKHVDIFVSFVTHDHRLAGSSEKAESRFEPFVKYKSRLNLPNAKLIIFSLSGRLDCSKEGVPPNVLDIIGLDPVACKVSEAFCRNSFS